MSKMKTLFAIDNGYILIEQSSNKNFRVTYGKQIKTFNNWESAFKEFGECVAHYLECEGVLSR